MNEFFFLTLILFFSSLSFAIRFKEDSKILTEPEDILHLELIVESPRDGQKVSYTLRTLKGDVIVLAKEQDLKDQFFYKIPIEFAGFGMSEIVAESETGSKCSTTIFIK